MRYLGIDYGSKRTGIAVSDENGAYAFPKKVFVTSGRLAEEVRKCTVEYGVHAIVMGESRDYSGAPNKIMSDIVSFKKELEGLTKLPVYLEPEFMTSMQAERLDRELGGKSSGKKSGSRGDEKSGKENKNRMLDATAAAFILQSFLDKRVLDKHASA